MQKIASNLEIIPTLENQFTEQQNHMRPPNSGKTVKITRKVLSNTISEEMDTKAEGNV